MPKLENSQRQLMETAKTIYEEKLKAQLEPEHVGKVIAVEPQSGDYVLGASLKEVDATCRTRFGSKPVRIFCVGGGGVKLFGNRDSARIHRRT